MLFSDTEKQVMPIIGKCLEGITKAGTNVNEKNVSFSETDDSIKFFKMYISLKFTSDVFHS